MSSSAPAYEPERVEGLSELRSRNESSRSSDDEKQAIPDKEKLEVTGDDLVTPDM